MQWHAKDKLVIVKVNADSEGRPLGTKYDVYVPSLYPK
jgi:hypothetical protein